MAERKKEGPARRPGRPPGRKEPAKRQFLVYLSPDLVKDVKIAAIREETSASAVAEQALREWLDRRSVAKEN